MDGDNRPWSEQYRIAGERWSDLEAAAQLLEDTKSAMLAQWCSELGPDMAVNRAEQIIKASPKWKEHVGKIVEARRVANRAKIELDYLKMRYYEMSGQDANKRAELRILGGTT